MRSCVVLCLIDTLCFYGILCVLAPSGSLVSSHCTGLQSFASLLLMTYVLQLTVFVSDPAWSSWIRPIGAPIGSNCSVQLWALLLFLRHVTESRLVISHGASVNHCPETSEHGTKTSTISAKLTLFDSEVKACATQCGKFGRMTERGTEWREWESWNSTSSGGTSLVAATTRIAETEEIWWGERQ